MVKKAETILDLGLKVFDAPKKFWEWTKKPCYLLNNKIPDDLMGTKEGREQVRHALQAIYHGFF